MANISQNNIELAKSEIEKAQSILIVLEANSSFDSIASSLAFYLALSSKGKQVSIVSSTPMTVKHSYLVGLDKITTLVNSQPGKNLVISFPYQEGSIEKVSYNIEGNTFNLVIEPREGFPLINTESVNFTQGGGKVDLIITIGVKNLSDLGSIYNANQNLFQNNTIINIDSNSDNKQFGKINLVNPNASSTSEMSVSLFSQLNLNFNNDIASNLLMGIQNGSQNFTSSQTSARTFEAAAMCFRNGAKISKNISPTSTPSQPKQTIPFSPPTFQGVDQKIQTTPKKAANQGFVPQKDFKKPVFKNSQQVNKKPKSAQEVKKGQNTSTKAPPDWLKPKIYRGSTLV